MVYWFVAGCFGFGWRLLRPPESFRKSVLAGKRRTLLAGGEQGSEIRRSTKVRDLSAGLLVEVPVRATGFLAPARAGFAKAFD
jgi:hypothetical protein